MEYVAGECLDLNGLEITAIYNDKHERVLDPSEYTTNPDTKTPLKEGDNSVEVIYDEKISTTFPITVNSPVVRSIRITNLPKTEFYIGDPFNSTGLEVTATLSDQTTRVLDLSEYTLSIAEGETLTAGEKEVTVKYTDEITTSYRIRVIDSSVISIEVTRFPKTNYYESERIMLGNLEVTATLENQAKRVLDKKEYTTSIKNDQILTLDDKEVVVTYSESIKTSFEITVTDVGLKDILITPPTKTEYVEGQYIDTAGMHVIFVYKDGTSSDVTEKCFTSPGKNTKLNIFMDSAKIYYHDPQYLYDRSIGSFDITVRKNVIEKLEIGHLPYRTHYYSGQKLNLDGLVVYGVMSDLSKKDITNDEQLDIDPREGSTLDGDDTVVVRYPGLHDAATFEITVEDSTPVLVSFDAGKGDIVEPNVNAHEKLITTMTGVFYKDLEGKPIAKWEDDSKRFVGWSLASDHYVPVNDEFEFRRNTMIYAYYESNLFVNIIKASFEHNETTMTIFVNLSDVGDLPDGTTLRLAKDSKDIVLNVTFDSEYGNINVKTDVSEDAILNVTVKNNNDIKGIEIELAQETILLISDETLLTKIEFDIAGYTLPNETKEVEYHQHISWDAVKYIYYLGPVWGHHGFTSTLIAGNYYIFRYEFADVGLQFVNHFAISNKDSVHLSIGKIAKVYHNGLLDTGWVPKIEDGAEKPNCLFREDGVVAVKEGDTISFLVQIDQNQQLEGYAPFSYFFN